MNCQVPKQRISCIHDDDKTKKKVSFGPSVTVKEIPLYSNDERNRLFYTDEEYNRFEVAENRRRRKIQILFAEYKYQRRMLALQQCLMEKEKRIVTVSNVSMIPSNSNHNQKRRKRESDETMEQQDSPLVSSPSQARQQSPDIRLVSSTNDLNPLTKRSRMSMVKLSAHAA